MLHNLDSGRGSHTAESKRDKSSCSLNFTDARARARAHTHTHTLHVREARDQWTGSAEYTYCLSKGHKRVLI